MKLDLENAKNPLYQKVLAYNSRNVPENVSILDIVCVDLDTNKKFTVKQLFEGLYEENEKLKEEILKIKNKMREMEEKNKENNNVQIKLVEALRNETREKGVL